jgi:hypothetical protein
MNQTAKERVALIDKDTPNWRAMPRVSDQVVDRRDQFNRGGLRAP